MPQHRQFLIVDQAPDEPLLREVLESSGRVHIVTTFDEATRAARERWLGALINTSLPSGNAIALARQLVSAGSTRCLVLLTSNGGSEDDIDLSGFPQILPGALPVLHRPMTARELSSFATRATVGLWTNDAKLTDLIVRYSTTKELTPRESEIVAAAMAGAGRSELARALDISENTLKGPIRVLLAKCGAPSVEALVNHVLRGAIE